MSGDISSSLSIDQATTANDEKVNYAVGCYVTAKSKGSKRLDIARYIKQEFDRKFGTPWHCIIGNGYSAYYTQADSGGRIKFIIGGERVHLFRRKTGTEPTSSARHYEHISPSKRQMITKSRMDKQMENHVFDCYRRACDTDRKDRLKKVVDEFDEEHNRGWNCILGEHFAVSVNASAHHDHKCFIEIQVKADLKLILFRC